MRARWRPRRLAVVLAMPVVLVVACSGGAETTDAGTGAALGSAVVHDGLTFAYELDGSLAEQGEGPSLVAHGGTLGTDGYSFGPNEGLSLELELGDSYTIEFRVRLDAAPLTALGWTKLLDFGDLTTDAGLYVYQSAPAFWFTAGCGTGSDISQGCLLGRSDRAPLVGSPETFTNTSFTTVRIVRDGAARTITAYTDNILHKWSPLTFPDSQPVEAINDALDEATLADAGVLHFLRDDLSTVDEATSGELDYIRITTGSPSA